ncbi:MAG: transcription-repair coupling factor [Candidatus Omnitrophica bacterium]|nr:transcription-repair coupling factor [Candidatus Omnitrophota bacterium]
MFDAIKIYPKEAIDIQRLLEELIGYGYTNVAGVAEVGDFSRRGEVIDVFPVTFELPLRIQLSGNIVEKIRSFDPATGRYAEEHTIAIILPITTLRPKKIKAPFIFTQPFFTSKKLFMAGRAGFTEEMPVNNFVDIAPGDYVVHVEHGIGIYKGLKHLKVKNKLADNFVIEYQDGDILYVPVSDLNLIQRYIGFEGSPPRVYKLGSKLWQKMKERAKKGVFTLAYELLELQAKRQALSGFGFSKDTDWQKELEAAFPYQETPDQARSTLEVKKDMEADRPMDRLLCGDVGYGKTEVALRAAFKAVMDNKQVAILVPTTILAEQHYNTFSTRLAKYPVNVQMLSRFKTESEQNAIIKGLKDGSVDVVIGTHRLISDDISLSDLGLVIIDEEQRFGVKHKEKLKKLRLLVDVFTLTATPIPRTLYMTIMGAKDLSVINTPPQGRQAVETHVAEYNDELIKEAIGLELRRGGQVFFVHNRVLDIDRVEGNIKKLFPQARIEIAHGQMSERTLESAMLKFIKGKIDILVSTAIIESGIDIPNANTIIVNRADMFGLSDLYQLRGRVGRFKRKAFAYFLVPKKEIMTKDVQKRLLAIKKFTELGSGFKIAMEDLQLRGAGNMLGEQQHGYIEAVGFDLYCRLLKGAITNLSLAKKARD